MIKIKYNKTNKIDIEVTNKLQLTDVEELTEVADKVIKDHGTVIVLINVSKFSGWENLATLKKHACFVKNHHKKVNKIAIITGAWWHNIILNIAKIYIRPRVKSFKLENMEQAKEWLNT